MRARNSTTASIALLAVLMLSTVPLAVADSGTAPASYAFLPSWDGNIPGTLDPTGESFTNGLEFSNHDFDENGNLYYIEADDYGNWMNNQYTLDGRGFHILKIDGSGTVEYTEKIQCSSYCTSPDYYYAKPLALEVVGEDQFYIVLSTRYETLTFDGLQYGSSSPNLVTAFYSNGAWSWVDVEVVSSTYAYSTLAHVETDGQSNLYLVQSAGNSGGWSEYTISSYSPNGTNWVRSMELPYQSPTYNYIQPLFDADESGFHAFVTVPSQMKYDSQTVQCPLGGENGYCHLWLSVNQAGVKTSAVGSTYTSVQFNRMQVHNDSLYLSGNTYDRVVSSHTESNFTGQKISHSPRYGQYVAIMEDDGSWGFHLLTNQQQDYYQYGYLTDVFDDGSFLFNSIYVEPFSINGTLITEHGNVDAQVVLSRIHPTNGLLWSSSVGFVNSNSYPYIMRSDGSTVAFHVSEPSNGDIHYRYQGADRSTIANGSSGTTNAVFWVDGDDGTIVDVETTQATGVYGRSNDGGVLAARNGYMYYYMPDFDGDNVGTGDNCPENYNPDQLDYNGNGDGDACDEDDDSDGVADVNDSCPKGQTGWLSDSMTDYDGDGCKDLGEEDLDDDSDGVPDITDACPVGISGAGYDLDGDGCKDTEDPDDDGDLVRDESDLCSTGEIDWSSGTLTDHDGDGCLDEHPEDTDDDNDGIADTADQCPRGATNWPSNINTDFDGDGCKDGFEDEDDDDDGISNGIDNCPRSIGVVNAQGCSATQSLDEEGGSSTVYYVCPVGSIVVLDPSDCPEPNDSTNTTNDTSDGQNDDTFYYVCPGGSDVVTDLSECEGSIGTGGTNVTLVIDPNANGSSDYITCDGGKAIVLDRANCPENVTQDVASSNSESSEYGLMLMFMGGTFAMSAIAMVVVLVRRPTRAEAAFQPVDSSERFFKEEPDIPQAVSLPSPPPSTGGGSPQVSRPSADLIGRSHEGKEWLEWPEGSDNHYYRELGFGGDWTRYE